MEKTILQHFDSLPEPIRTMAIDNLEKEMFDFIVFKNGYSKNAPTMLVEWNGIEVKEGNKQWGAPGHRVFAIKLGKIIESLNCN
jgi:hypothetical protein